MGNDLRTKLMLCLLIAIEAIFCFTPLGTIPIGLIAATLSMVPVIIAALSLGKIAGMILGLTFAIFSFIYWTFILPAYPTAFLFTPFSEFAEYKGNFGSLIICFVPRILAGFVPAFMRKKSGDIVAAMLGSLTNTVFVLIFIFIFFRNEYASIMGKSIIYVLGISVLTNGIPECIICAIVCPLVSKILRNKIIDAK